jgi:hypothetical protein
MFGVSKALRVYVMAIASAVLLAYVLNPSPERHRAKIEAAISSSSPLAATFGLGSVTAFCRPTNPSA